MDEQTVNEEPIFEASDIETQDVEKTEDVGSPAVEETGEQSTSEDEAIEEPAVSETQTETQTGDEIDDFLAKKGIKSDDPDALRKVADMYRNVEKEFGKKSQEKAKLEREISESRAPVSSDQQALAEVRQLKTEISVANWKKAKDLTPEQEQKMIEYCQQPVIGPNGQTMPGITKGHLIVNGFLSLDEAYKLAGCETQKTGELKANLKSEIVKEMQARQVAKRPAAKATDSTQFAKPEEKDPFAEGLGL